MSIDGQVTISRIRALALFAMPQMLGRAKISKRFAAPQSKSGHSSRSNYRRSYRTSGLKGWHQSRMSKSWNPKFNRYGWQTMSNVGLLLTLSSFDARERICPICRPKLRNSRPPWKIPSGSCSKSGNPRITSRTYLPPCE